MFTTRESTVMPIDCKTLTRMKCIKHRRRLYLYIRSTFNTTSPYEIIFKSSNILGFCSYYSVWRFMDLKQASARFRVMARLLKNVFYKRCTILCIQAKTFLQQMVNVMFDQPGWKEVHIAVINSYDDFFCGRSLKSGRINKQHPPDMLTPLHLAIQYNFAEAILTLLYNNADVNLRDNTGQTPFHQAIRRGDAQLVKKLIVFGADINLPDNDGQSPRHMAATQDDGQILALLLALRAAPCTARTIECDHGCLAEEWPKSTLESSPFYSNAKHGALAKVILAGQLRVEETVEMMACFDGGGIGGLITVQVMLELSKYLKHPLGNYFDCLAGTSTGALIAWALSTGRSLFTIRRLYFTLKNQVFLGQRPYDASNLNRCMQTEFGATTKLDSAFKKVLIMATGVDRSPPKLQVFRSFPTENDTTEAEKLNEWPAWKALRASSAAPTYFSSHDNYVDGGLVANNPTVDALTQYFGYQPPGRPNTLKLVVSFGTSRTKSIKSNSITRFNYVESVRDFGAGACYPPGWSSILKLIGDLASVATQANDNEVSKADSWCSALETLFFRINPVLEKYLKLDEKDTAVLIEALWKVKLWSVVNEEQLKQVADVMEMLQTLKENGGRNRQ